jgi:hypothetical protein
LETRGNSVKLLSPKQNKSGKNMGGEERYGRRKKEKENQKKETEGRPK